MTPLELPPGTSDRKRRVLELSHEYLIPHRVEVLLGLRAPLVIGRREGYRIWDLDGHELLDFHLNGGVYNLGHRHPEVLGALRDALETRDLGNHHLPSEPRAELAEKLAHRTPGDLHISVYTTSASEANDVAIQSVRWATGRRRIVGLEAGYHGRTGLSGAAGDSRAAAFFRSDRPDEFATVPFDDLDALEAALRARDVAGVILEPLPATYGFPVPSASYLPGVRSLCDRYGTKLIADEVQTGLGRSGHLWAVECWDVVPDVLVAGKGLSGGVAPIAVAVLTREVGAWVRENGWGFVSTFGGSELGCAVASRVLDLCADPASLAHARRLAERMGRGLQEIRQREPFLKDVRQQGLLIGLEFDHPYGGVAMMGPLYEAGIWAFFAGFQTSVTQFKPGLLLDEATADEALDRLETAVRRGKFAVRGAGGSGAP